MATFENIRAGGSEGLILMRLTILRLALPGLAKAYSRQLGTLSAQIGLFLKINREISLNLINICRGASTAVSFSRELFLGFSRWDGIFMCPLGEGTNLGAAGKGFHR